MPLPVPAFSRPGRSRGFTLVEVLLVLALIALVSAILLPSATALFPKAGAGNVEDNVAEVLQQVRREAVTSGREVVLRFDGREQRLVWDGGTSGPLVTADRRLAVDFLRTAGAASSVLIGGQLVETATVPLVRFYPDGTCDPVRVQLRIGNAERRLLVIDPWTCAPGLEVRR